MRIHVNIFRQCVPEKGMGFVPGAYKCVCQDGYFFPRVHSEVRAYTGLEIENWTRNSNNSLGDGMFRCSKCAAGCDTCVDDSPCLHQRSNAVVISLLILNLLTVAGIIGIAVATYLYRHEMVKINTYV
jgi:G protein-coupled receptor 158